MLAKLSCTPVRIPPGVCHELRSQIRLRHYDNVTVCGWDLGLWEYRQFRCVPYMWQITRPVFGVWGESH